MMPKATKVGVDGLVSPRNISSETTTPVCASKVASQHFLPVGEPYFLFSPAVQLTTAVIGTEFVSLGAGVTGEMKRKRWPSAVTS